MKHATLKGIAYGGGNIERQGVIDRREGLLDTLKLPIRTCYASCPVLIRTIYCGDNGLSTEIGGLCISSKPERGK